MPAKILLRFSYDSARLSNIRLSEAPSEDCRGEAIRRKRAIPMPAQILLRFSYDSARQSNIRLSEAPSEDCYNSARLSRRSYIEDGPT